MRERGRVEHTTPGANECRQRHHRHTPDIGETLTHDGIIGAIRQHNESITYQLFRRGDEIQEFMLKETATPMDNGKHLTLGHWLWLFHHQSQRSEVEQDAWLGRELAWLRKESPAAAVLEHVDAVLEDEHKREMDQLRESAREVIGMLEMI